MTSHCRGRGGACLDGLREGRYGSEQCTPNQVLEDDSSRLRSHDQGYKSSTLDAPAQLGVQDDGGGGRRGGHLGLASPPIDGSSAARMAAAAGVEVISALASSLPTYPWKLGGRDGGGRTAVLDANGPVERYPTTEMTSAVTSRPSSAARRPGTTRRPGWEAATDERR